MSNKSSFSKYYADPEYRRRHLEYGAEKVECECGTKVSRHNLGHHKNTNKHQIWLREHEKIGTINNKKISELEEEMKELKKEIKKMKKKNH